MAITLAAARHEVPDDPVAFFEFAIARGWSDGLPMIPPTPARVAGMLEHVARDPASVVARLDPRQGAATVERIAINAVMAGCAAEHLPVLIAAVEAVADPEFNLHGIQATTNPVAPMLVVNGPARRAAGLNGGRNALGPGCRGNATIGRALRLCLLNIGGGVPGDVDKAILGMPGKYTFCLAENEEESPWEPLHVERGLEGGESAVTAIGVQGTNNLLVLSGHAEDALHVTADAMATMGNNNVLIGRGNPIVLFSPGHARQLFDQGFRTRDAVRDYLFARARIPLDRFPARDILPGRPLRERAIDGAVPAVQRAEDLLVVVAGGPEPYHITYCPSFGDTRAVTRRIE